MESAPSGPSWGRIGGGYHCTLKNFISRSTVLGVKHCFKDICKLSVPSISKEVLALGNTTGIFDREKSDFHFLTVEARDDLGRGNRNTVELLIRLTDVNDNPPIFEQKEYVGFLKENNLSFEQTVFVSARDADENGTENSVVRYRIVQGNLDGNFTIDSVTGKKY